MANKTVTEIGNEKPMGFGPAIDDETMRRMEEGASSKGTGISRRIVLLVVCRSAEQLGQISLDEPECYSQMRGDVESFRDHAKALLEVAEAAVLRMKICDLCE